MATNEHFSIMKASLIEYGILLFQCLCGIVLNIGILVLFFIMKQVRGSVYASYMIQIAVTDVLVCLAWFTYSAQSIIYIRNLLQGYNAVDKDQPIDDFSFTDTPLNAIEVVYYFHFYINIFLLAAMSVERFVAVWKSLRCQRYQFNKKFTYAVSALMWLLALICVLPTIVDMELSNGEPVNIEKFDFSSPPEKLLNDQLLREEGENWVLLLDCWKLMQDAKDYQILHPNETVYVESLGNITVTSCIMFFEDVTSDKLGDSSDLLMTGSGEEFELEDGMEPFLESYSATDYTFNYTHDYIRYQKTRKNEELHPVAQMDDFQFLLKITFLTMMASQQTSRSHCSQSLSRNSKIYVIIINIVIGFFVPYLAIVCSYIGIACMISRRAKQRLQHPFHTSTTSITYLGRRMSTFLRSMVHSHDSGPQTVKASPLLSKPPTNPPLPPPPVTVTDTSRRSDVIKPRHLIGAAFTSAQLRRISGGSASSAESFLTDQTSIQTSPGVRLSQPIFIHDKLQRATSVDSNSPNKRFSSNDFIFRASDDVKCKVVEEKEEAVSSVRDVSTPLCVLPESVALKDEAMTSSKCLMMTSFKEQNDSVASTCQRMTSEPMKTTAHRNAERHLKIAVTVTAYVIIFSVCWLPQRIKYIFYILEGMSHLDLMSCQVIVVVVRVISFFSVVLNPIVYATTQRDIRNYIRRLMVRIRKRLRWRRSTKDATKDTGKIFKKDANIEDAAQLSLLHPQKEMNPPQICLSNDLRQASNSNSKAVSDGKMRGKKIDQQARSMENALKIPDQKERLKIEKLNGWKKSNRTETLTKTEKLNESNL